MLNVLLSLPRGHLNVLLRSRKLADSAVLSELFSGMGDDDDTPMHPHAVYSPHPMPFIECESLLIWLSLCLS